jgi:hypothetical protein
MDEFKPFSEIFEPSPQRKIFKLTLEEHYDDIKEINLYDNVSERIRQYFDTARNLALYSWFVYSFTPVADFQAYACLEFALVQKTGKYVPGKFYSFKNLLEDAIERGWIKDIGFRYWRKLEARRKKYQEEQDDMLSQLGYPHESTLPVDPQKYSKTLIKGFALVRNYLAHGTPMVWIWSSLTLNLVADCINQLYSSNDTTSKAGE